MLNELNFKDSVYFKRRSIRKFLTTPVEEWKINAIITAVFQTPSAKNQMPWEIIKINDQKVLSNLSNHHKYRDAIRNAPYALVITSTEYYQNLPAGLLVDHDLGAACLQATLIATELGLGSVWCAVAPFADREEGFRGVLNIPKSVKVFAIILIGYSDEKKENNNKYFPDKIHENRW